MKYGIFLPQLGNIATRENIEIIAKSAESFGYDSLWVLERQLWPIKPQVRFPATQDGLLPEYYKNVLDPIETLTYAAAITRKIKLGTSVIDMLFHLPVILGRRLATLDILSNGRLVVGLGLGWSPDEFQIAGVPFSKRGERADEFLQALIAVWTHEIVEFCGTHYQIPPSIIGPKPQQRPRPKIFLGGASPQTFSRIAKFADGWLGTIHADFGKLEHFLKILKKEGEKTGRRDIGTILLEHPMVTNTRENRSPLTGSIEQIASDLKIIESYGVDEVILSFRGWDVDELLKNMKDLKTALITSS